MGVLIGTIAMRRFAAILLFAASLPLAAQERPRLEPVPEPPPPAPGFNFDAAVDEPRVVIRKGDSQQIEERTTATGKKSITVTSPSGTTYELREDIGDSSGSRLPGDTGLRVPLWQIYSF